MKLKLAVLLPTLAVMLALVVLAFIQPELIRVLTFLIPAVGVVGSFVGLFLERSRRKTKDVKSPLKEERDKRVRFRIAVAAAILMAILLGLIVTQPSLTLPLGIVVGLIALSSIGLSLSMGHSTRR